MNTMDVKHPTPAPVAKQSASSVTRGIRLEPKDSPAEEFRKYIEVEVLRVIRDLADGGAITKERIQEIARLTLTLIHPGMTIEQLYNNAVKLDDSHSELAPVVFKIMKEYEDRYSQKAINAVSGLIKDGKYDEAQDLVKKVLMFKMSN